MNIIIIVSDTFRKDHLGCYGNSKISTPYLDLFAKRCIQFNNYFAASFPTMPNRADIFTGKFTFTYLGWVPLPQEEVTLAEVLNQAGYTTAAVVDTPFFLRNGYGYDKGFEDFVWIPGQSSLPSGILPKQGLRVINERRYEEDYFAPKTMATAEKLLERHYKDKFFLYVDTWDPHEPWDPPSWYVDLYYNKYEGQVVEPCYGDWKECGLKKEDVEIAHACYKGEITMVDRWVGQLLEKIELMGLLNNTILIFTSDHGFFFGEHGYFGKMKRDKMGGWYYSPLYQEITRIPLLVYVPGLEPKQSHAFTQPPDLMPTVLEVLGLECPQSVQGHSFFSVLKGEKEDFRDLVITSLPLYNIGEKTRVVDNFERNIKEPFPSTVANREWTLLYSIKDQPSELYNIKDDPDQSENVINHKFEVAKNLHHRFIDFLKKVNTKDYYIEPRKIINKL